MKMYGKMFEVLTSKKPRDLYDLLKDKFSTNKKSIEEGIVIWHENFVSGSNFSTEYKNSRKWHHKFFDHKGQF